MRPAHSALALSVHYPETLLNRRIAVLARLAGDAAELVQSHRWMAVPAATLGRQQTAAPSG
jgi:hypothetical protein